MTPLKKELQQVVDYASNLGLNITYFAGTIEYSEGSHVTWNHHVVGNENGKK